MGGGIDARILVMRRSDPGSDRQNPNVPFGQDIASIDTRRCAPFSNGGGHPIDDEGKRCFQATRLMVGDAG
jgi:hypothetical protein